jgi:glycosyltransferase involved in cell wall biosynthesis
LVLFCHPGFQKSQSMPRFARMLESAYTARGHTVSLWTPQAKFFKWFSGTRFAKWAGYIDQYLLFPFQVRRAARMVSKETLFVFCDQALGPWVPLVKNRPHVVHAHDLLALRSALGDIPENPTGFTGRIYQRFIRRGFRQARNFISISTKTRADLHHFGGVTPAISEVVYNGLNFPYVPMPRAAALQALRDAQFEVPAEGFLLNVGGSQWYKNLPGVIAIYADYVALEEHPLPLWCIGPPPNAAVQAELARVAERGQVRFHQNLDNLALQAVYSCARALLFPSLAEGFGWPLIEAQACGCPVITTDEAPMNEIGGEDAIYLPRLKFGENLHAWSAYGATVLRKVLAASPVEQNARSERGRAWANGFDPDVSIQKYLSIYDKILAGFRS